MKPSIRKHASRLALLGAAWLLGACNSTEPGVDEFQNAKVDAPTAGKSLAEGFVLLNQWDASFSMPVAPATLDRSTQIGLLKRSTALPKSAASGNIEIDYRDTAKGFVTAHAETRGILVTHYDTAVIAYDAEFKAGNEEKYSLIRFKRTSVHDLGKVESAAFSDADDNGILNAVPGVNNKARVVFTTAQAGVTETADIVAGAGPDNDFNADADNPVFSASWTRVRGGTVIAKAEFKDQDKDGKLADNGSDQVVAIEWFEQSPAGKPLVRKATARAVVRVLAGKAGDEPVTFSYTEELITGRVNAVSLRNRHGEDEILKNDTLWVTIETTKSAQNDTLQHAAITVVMNPGEDLKSDADDLCYAFHIETQKRFGFERSAEFHFVAGEPVPHGQDPVSGTFEGQATYANGQSASLKGSFSPTGFDAEFTGPEGTVSISFSAQGNVI